MGKPEGGSEYYLVMVHYPPLSFWRLSEGELTGDQRAKPPGTQGESVCTKLAFSPSNHLFYSTFRPQMYILLLA